MKITATKKVGETRAVRVDKEYLELYRNKVSYELTLIDEEVGTMVITMNPLEFRHLARMVSSMLEFTP